MRRTPAEDDSSFVILNFPSSPVWGDVWTTTDFDRDQASIYCVRSVLWSARTDGVNSDTIRVAIAEGAVGMQSVESVIFVIFSIDNWKIGFNPGVHSILDFLSSSEVSL